MNFTCPEELKLDVVSVHKSWPGESQHFNAINIPLLTVEDKSYWVAALLPADWSIQCQERRQPLKYWGGKLYYDAAWYSLSIEL